MEKKPKLLIISSVMPFPGFSGQQQRVKNKLLSLRKYFHITFLGSENYNRLKFAKDEVSKFCDDSIVLPNIYSITYMKLLIKVVGTLWAISKGLKFSNFLVGKVEMNPARIENVISKHHFDLVLFEYWHTVDLIDIFQKKNIPTYLDMHNILWKSFHAQVSRKKNIPEKIKKIWVQRYKSHEETAWMKYDGIIAINQAEHDYVKSKINKSTKLLYAPMGIDLDLWPYCYEPVNPKRVVYFGGLGSDHNQNEVLKCYNQIMPSLWEKYSDIEFWIVGSNPRKKIKQLMVHDRRVNVTGYLEDVVKILKTMSFLICPWSGKYGFRSRIIEVMAIGVPVVTSFDAVHGMGLKNNHGILLSNTTKTMIKNCKTILNDQTLLFDHSFKAREQIEKMFSFQNTYGVLSKKIFENINES